MVKHLNHEGYEQYLLSYDDRFFSNGIEYVFIFPNGYGANVFKLGGLLLKANDDLWCLAVTYDYQVTYDTQIADAIIHDLTDEEVCCYLTMILEL